MRQIKFRAWHEEGQEMVNFNNEKLCADEYQRVHLAALMAGRYGDVLMQFTGLLDANGVEIYEGDICIWYINNLERLGEVYYHDQSFEMRSPSLGYIGWDANRGEVKVIGNIYQNPELLK